jgi:hypothetical protein
MINYYPKREEHEVKDTFIPLIIESFWIIYILDGYFVLPPHNYLVGRYATCTYSMSKKLVLLHDLAMFNCIVIIYHYFKY